MDQKVHFFEKTGTKNFTTPYSIPFVIVLQHIKALHNLKKGQRPIIGSIKGLGPDHRNLP